MKEYEYIVNEKLGLTINKIQDYDDIITQRIKTAKEQIEKLASNPDPLSLASMYAINQCIHLASSLVLLTSDSNVLREALRYVTDNLVTIADATTSGTKVDATTLVTIAVLYFLTHNYNPVDDDKAAAFEAIRQRFNEVNWLIGHDLYEKLISDHNNS